MSQISIASLVSCFLFVTSCTSPLSPELPEKIVKEKTSRPNILFIFADDLREDTLGVNNSLLHTPNLDALAGRSYRFNQAFSVLAVCSPSRATILTGRYPSSHGVTTYGDTPVKAGNPSFVEDLKLAGYRTGIVGKWHLGNEPEEMGFEIADIFHGNGTWYGRKVIEQGEHTRYPGFIETWSVDRSIRFIEQISQTTQPFFLWYNTQVPHMDHDFSWPASEEAMAHYKSENMPIPLSYPPDHEATGKPPYLEKSRSYTRAMEVYGYREEQNLRGHIRDYYAAVSDMDREIGRLLKKLNEMGLADNTYIIFMSDNGWFLGEHGLTSKVLAYKPSMQVPLFVAGPNIKSADSNALVSNADIAPFILDLAQVEVSQRLDGQSLKPLLGPTKGTWRDYIYYESPTPQLVPRSFYAIRDHQYLYIETFHESSSTTPEFIELYDVNNDPHELNNLASAAVSQTLVEKYSKQLKSARMHFGSL